jgi:hypothetical protein
MKKKETAIKMSRADFIREHKRLTRVLKTGKGRTQEYKDQEKELQKIEHDS